MSISSSDLLETAIQHLQNARDMIVSGAVDDLRVQSALRLAVQNIDNAKAHIQRESKYKKEALSTLSAKYDTAFMDEEDEPVHWNPIRRSK